MNPAGNIIIIMTGDAISEKMQLPAQMSSRIVREATPSADAPAGCEEITTMGIEGAAILRDSASWCS